MALPGLAVNSTEVTGPQPELASQLPVMVQKSAGRRIGAQPPVGGWPHACGGAGVELERARWCIHQDGHQDLRHAEDQRCETEEHRTYLRQPIDGRGHECVTTAARTTVAGIGASAAHRAACRSPAPRPGAATTGR